MFKEFLCGFAMVADLSGRHYRDSQPAHTSIQDRIASYWQSVGAVLESAVQNEKPAVETERQRRQLNLNLN